MPWTGMIVQQNGDVKNCVLSKKVLGNLRDSSIQDILTGEENTNIKKQMLAGNKPKSCEGCYKLEQGKNNFDIISQRIYYIKQLREVDPELYDNPDAFDLHSVDIRWTNQCNQACVYCGPHNSSLWQKEIGGSTKMTHDAKKALRDYIFSNISQLKNIYLAGGEPTLMNENIPFLQILLEENPEVTLRVNTNLANVDTKVSRLIRRFKNVHWTVSVESTNDHYKYIRYGGDWSVFISNLDQISKIQGHKISFNMLYCILNHKELFRCIDLLSERGFHDNSFVLGPVETPIYLNIRQLPAEKLDWVKEELNNRIAQKPGFILEDGYRNLLNYVNGEHLNDIHYSFQQLKALDTRRNINSEKILKDLYE